MTSIVIVALVLPLVACGSPGWRTTPYQHEMLNVRTRGAETLALETERDPAIRRYVEHAGPPDFVLVTGPRDVELVYYQDSRLVHFHRAETTEQGELSPLPLEVVNVLPVDIRAGTPGRIDPETPLLTGGGHVPVERDVCRTCRAAPRACSTDCRPAEGGRT